MGLIFQEPKNISQVFCLLLQNGSTQWFKSKLDCNAREGGSLTLSCPTIKNSSVSKPYCPPAAQPSWMQSLPAATANGQNPTTVRSINPPSFLLRLGNRCLQTPCLDCHSLPCFCLLFSNTRRQHLMPYWALPSFISTRNLFAPSPAKMTLMQCLLFLPPSSSVLFSSLHSPANPGFIFQFPSVWVLPLHSPCHLALPSPPLQHVCIWPLPRSKIPQMSFENMPCN